MRIFTVLPDLPLFPDEKPSVRFASPSPERLCLFSSANSNSASIPDNAAQLVRENETIVGHRAENEKVREGFTAADLVAHAIINLAALIRPTRQACECSGQRALTVGHHAVRSIDRKEALMYYAAGALAVLAGLFYAAGHRELGSFGADMCRYGSMFCDNPHYVLVGAGLAAVWGMFVSVR